MAVTSKSKTLVFHLSYILTQLALVEVLAELMIKV